MSAFRGRTAALVVFLICFQFISMIVVPTTTTVSPHTMEMPVIIATGALANCSNATTDAGRITSETVTIFCKTFAYRMPPNFAHQDDAQSLSPRILFGVLSNDPTRRINVRSTWAKDIPKGSYIFFIVAGEWNDDMAKEYSTHLDILWLEKPEIYRELSYKTGAFVSIAHYYYANYYTHLFKTDDDSYLNVMELSHTLQQQRPTPIDFLGYCHLQPTLPVRPEQPLTKPWMKDFILTFQEYPEKWQAPYCSGAGYALSPKFVLCAARHFSVIRHHPFEDVAMGLMAERCGITATHTGSIYPERRGRRNNKNNMTGVLVQHRAIESRMMNRLHDSIFHAHL